MKYLVSTNYRTTGKSVIWMLDMKHLKLEPFREDQYYESAQEERRERSSTSKDYIYFGMDMYRRKVYCVGGNVLTILGSKGELLKRKQVKRLRDAHDLRVLDGLVYCTNTGRDSVEVFSPGLEHKKTIDLKDLHCFRNERLLPKNENSPDSLHANFLSVKDRQIFVTHSFTSKRDIVHTIILGLRRIARAAGLSFSRNAGIILAARSGKVLKAGGVITLSGSRILRSIHGAHDGRFFDGHFYINSSHNIETLIYDQDFHFVRSIEYNLGALLRGLCPVDRGTLLIGATRIDPNRTASSIYRRVLRARGTDSTMENTSSVKVVDMRRGKIRESLEFDKFKGVSPEVYQIIPFN